MPERREPVRSLRRMAGPGALALLAVVAACAAGCYRKVVGVRGLGTSGVQVEQPTQPTLIDRLLGAPPAHTDDRPRIRVN